MSQRGTDDGLMYAIRQGDTLAFKQLVARHRSWVQRMMLGIVHDPAAAEDLTQEVFWQVYQHRERYVLQDKFIPWLKQIALNRARSHLRARQRERTVELPDLGEVHADAGRSDPGVLVPLHLLQQEVRDALNALEEGHREVAMRYYLRGESIREIAAHVGCPEGTVKSRLHTSRCQLRERLRTLWVGSKE